MELRDGGVYKLADWQELVAVRGRDGMFWLLTPEHWRAGGALYYRVTPSGRLVYHGPVTQWSVKELADTGLTATPPDRLIHYAGGDRTRGGAV